MPLSKRQWMATRRFQGQQVRGNIIIKRIGSVSKACHGHNGGPPSPTQWAAVPVGFIVAFDLLTGRHNRNQIVSLERNWEFATLQIFVSKPNRKLRQI